MHNNSIAINIYLYSVRWLLGSSKVDCWPTRLSIYLCTMFAKSLRTFKSSEVKERGTNEKRGESGSNRLRREQRQFLRWHCSNFLSNRVVWQGVWLTRIKPTFVTSWADSVYSSILNNRHFLFGTAYKSVNICLFRKLLLSSALNFKGNAKKRLITWKFIFVHFRA